jgi:uncharacterized membrane protein
MPLPGCRSGRVGILATLVLMISIVLFIGCLFWLTTNGPWGGGSLFGDDLFKPASMQKTETKPELNPELETEIEPEYELNIFEAIEDLTDSGCVFTEYTGTYSGTETTRLDYQQFREEAIKRTIVFTAEISPDVPVLLVIRDENTYEWSP